MSYKLSQKSLNKLEGVHQDLCKVVKSAIEISTVDFTILEGKRTIARQKVLLAQGATTTLNSRHITGHAVDLAAFIAGRVRWDWPLYYKIADAMKQASKELNIPIVWGGDWVTFKDGPHFELDRNFYK